MEWSFKQSYVLGAILALIISGAIVGSEFLGESSGLSCPALFGTANVTGNGFYLGNGEQYVIRPGSNGLIRIDYTNIADSNTIFVNSSRYFQPVRYWFKLGTSVGSITEVSSNTIGLTAVPTFVAVSGMHSIVAVYQINASARATPGTYEQSFPSVCGPYPLITVGTAYYSGSFPSNLIYH